MEHRGTPPQNGRPWQTQRTKRQTNGRMDEETRLFVRPSVCLRWSLTLCIQIACAFIQFRM